MAVPIRTMVHLEKGARLYYNCPMMSMEDGESDRFFKKYHGKTATFVSYCEDLIGPFDRHGRPPGRYINGTFINAQFEGESETHRLKFVHLLILRSEHVSIAKSADEGDRLGDLPFHILFYPGDTVMYRAKPEEAEAGPYVVTTIPHIPLLSDPSSSVSQNPTGAVQYCVAETDEAHKARVAAIPKEKPDANEDTGTFFNSISRRMFEENRKSWYATADQLRLVNRGNAWAIYHDPKWLKFDSDEKELAFLAEDGVSSATPSESIYPGISFAKAWGLYRSGAADLIEVQMNNRQEIAYALERGEKKEPTYFTARRLHDCFAEHRNHVRVVTHKFWHKKAKTLT